MNPALTALFDEPEKAYLKPEELNVLSQFVSSLPERINIYRRLRNDELPLMQAVADNLQQEFPQESEERLKRSIQNGILALRCVAMAMLIDDPDFVSKRLASWLPDIIAGYGTRDIDTALYRLVKQEFSDRFKAQQIALISPALETAQGLLSPHQGADEATAANETLVSLFE